MESHYEIP